jgi:hypothetical protein
MEVMAFGFPNLANGNTFNKTFFPVYRGGRLGVNRRSIEVASHFRGFGFLEVLVAWGMEPLCPLGISP